MGGLYKPVCKCKNCGHIKKFYLKYNNNRFNDAYGNIPFMKFYHNCPSGILGVYEIIGFQEVED